jgi:hypothetical protein
MLRKIRLRLRKKFAWVFLAMITAITGMMLCGGCADKPNPEDVEAIMCLVQGGDWIDGKCVYPEPVPDPEPEPIDPPPPVTEGKPFPQGVPEAEYTKLPATSERAEDVNKVMAEITSCTVGSRCLHNKSPQEWMSVVVLALRVRGIDAGQHIDGVTDEIAVRDTGCDWESYHITTFAPKPTVVWTPYANRPKYRIPLVYCSLDPVPVASCPDPQPNREKLRLDVKSHGRNKWDLTPKQIKSCQYCKDIGMGEYNGIPRCGCPIRPEGNKFRSACEQFIIGGAPRWFCDGAEIESEGNPFQAFCSGEVQACTVDLQVCS